MADYNEPIRKWLSQFGRNNKGRFRLPMPILWSVEIDPGESLMKTVGETLKKIKYKQELDSRIEDYMDTVHDNFSNILVAQEVTIPNESLIATNMGSANRGAYMPGQGIVERSDFLSRSATVNFLETHTDIVDDIFRPWIIALSVDGLINAKLKAPTMKVTQYGNDGKKRKQFTFKEIFPTNCEGYNMNYENTDFVVKTVTLAYKEYVIDHFNKEPKYG
jgi:hypothetical protein